MTGFALRRLVWPDGSSSPDVFNIMHDGTVVGRVYRTNGVGREQWRWTHYWYTREPNGGVADTIEDAKAAFRAAWGARQPAAS
jgi:hypothetical protein